MALVHSPRIVIDGLVLALDAGNLKSYPGSSNVSLLLHGDGTNGSTAIVDSSSNNHTITAYGNAQISTTQSKFGGSSMYFDGSGDYIESSSSSTLAFGTGDFTVEMWLYPLSTNSGLSVFFNNLLNAGNGNGFYLWMHSANTGYFSIDLLVSDFSYTINSSADDIAANAWSHFAICRSGTTVRMFVNGSEVSSATMSTNLTSTQIRLANPLGNISGSDWNGYIDDLRITKGLSRYTSNFTPPTTAFPADTALPADQATQWTDLIESNNGTLTNGPTYSSDDGGSIVFDGTDDYVQLSASSDLNFGTGNFTIEGWFNKDATTANLALLCSNKYYTFGYNGNWILRISSATQIAFAAYDGTGNLEYTEFSASTSVDTWHHFALVREGTGTNETKFYLDGVLKGSMTVSKSLNDAGTNGLRIGEESDGGPGNAPFNGKISNIKIYKGKGFTAAEVLQNYNTLKGRYV